MSEPVTIYGDPTTMLDVDYSSDETEFMLAMERYRSENRRRFPTCREVLAVLQSLGYRRTEAAGPLPRYHNGCVGNHSDGKTNTAEELDVPQVMRVERKTHPPGTMSRIYNG